MAYGVQSINEYVLPGSATTENTTQLDTLFFTDFHQATGPSSTSPAQGGVFYGNSANGGGISNNASATFEAFGVANSSGVISLTTGTTNNSTGYANVYTSAFIIPGITAPGTGLVTKYEAEALIRTDATIHSNAVRGIYRFGLMNSVSNTQSADGVYYEFQCNGTTNDTTWNIVFRKDNSEERVNTTLAVSANKTYRLYLCVEVATNGTLTTTYKAKNVTDSTSAESTATPSNLARYPTGSADYMGLGLINQKTTTSTTTSVALFADYMGLRIRRPVTREILLFS